MAMRYFLQGSGGSRAQEAGAPSPQPEYALGVFLGLGVRLVGALHSDQDVVIRGRVEGPVSAGGEVVVDEGGLVEGDIAAATIRVRGRTHGALAATERVILEAGSDHRGIIRGPTLAVEIGARIQGEVKVGPGTAADEIKREEGKEGEQPPQTLT